MGKSMNLRNLVLRGYAEKVDDQWQIFCVDLNLAAQADTFDDARNKLESMVVEYVYDALVGEDKAHAAELLSRKAPMGFWLKYYYIKAICHVGALKNGLKCLFDLPLPMEPVKPHHP